MLTPQKNFITRIWNALSNLMHFYGPAIWTYEINFREHAASACGDRRL